MNSWLPIENVLFGTCSLNVYVPKIKTLHVVSHFSNECTDSNSFFLFYIAKYQFGQKSMLYKRSCAKTVCDKIHSADQRHMYNVHVANNWLITDNRFLHIAGLVSGGYIS